MPNLINKLMLDELQEHLREHEGGVFVDFSGISVEQVNDLRSRFEESEVTFKVLKNRIAKRAFQTLDLDVSEILSGPTAYAFGNAEQAVGAAKIIQDARKEIVNLKVKGAVFEHEVLDGRAATALARLPDRPTMQAMIASALSAPARSIATAIHQVMTGIAHCIQEKIDKVAEGA